MKKKISLLCVFVLASCYSNTKDNVGIELGWEKKEAPASDLIEDFNLERFRIIKVLHDDKNLKDIIFATERNDWQDYKCSWTSNQSCYIFIESYENVWVQSKLNFIWTYEWDACSWIESKTPLEIIDVNTIHIEQEEYLEWIDWPCKDIDYPKIINLNTLNK